MAPPEGGHLKTDGWAAFQSLEDHGYEFDFVNHSENFFKPDCPDLHTDTIEGVVFQFSHGITDFD